MKDYIIWVAQGWPKIDKRLSFEDVLGIMGGEIDNAPPIIRMS